jgi:hypothetical protein
VDGVSPEIADKTTDTIFRRAVFYAMALHDEY